MDLPALPVSGPALSLCISMCSLYFCLLAMLNKHLGPLTRIVVGSFLAFVALLVYSNFVVWARL